MRKFRFRLSSNRRAGALKLAGVVATVAAALVAGSEASGAPNRFDMGVYDPVANQNGGGQAYSTLDEPLAMEKTAATGSRFVRIPINWDRVVCSNRSTPCMQGDRPLNPRDHTSPEYVWDRGGGGQFGGWYDYDEEIAQAIQKGLEPVLSVFGAPAFAECNGQGRRPGTAGRLICPSGDKGLDGANWRPSPADYAAFLTAVSKRWPQVRFFQIWNEPNYSAFLKPARTQRTINRYRALVNAGYDAINAVKRTDVVIAGGTSPNPRTGPGPDAWGPLPFLKRLVERRIRFDVYATHPYTQGGPRKSAPRRSGAIWMGDLWRVDRVLRKAKRAGKIRGRPLQFWAGEFGWDSAPPDCRRLHWTSNWGYHRAVRGALLTRWISDSAYQMWRQGVSAMIWGQLKDYPLAQNPHQGGLFFWGGNFDVGQAKGSLRAFKFPFVAFKRRGGAFVWGRRPDSQTGQVLIQRKKRGDWDTVKRVNARAGRHGLFSARLHFSRWRVRAMRARVPGTGQISAPFALKRPRTPSGILPFGCAAHSQPVP